MAQTPEGRVKAAVKKLLRQYEPDLKFDMPVPYGYGRATVDFIGVYKGAGFCIETKAPGKRPSALQEDFIQEWQRAGGVAFVIAGSTKQDLAGLLGWLQRGAWTPCEFPERPII